MLGSCLTCLMKGRARSPLESWTQDGVLQATEVLAKHDENYMPPEVMDALEQSGYDHKGVKQ